jgi:hypothetical protein
VEGEIYLYPSGFLSPNQQPPAATREQLPMLFPEGKASISDCTGEDKEL